MISPDMSRQIYHKIVTVNGVDIFYREAGKDNKLSILLLHGFPSSSVSFKNLITALSDQYHLIAPDYPGFGFSAFPDKNDFEYSFQSISNIINSFTEEIDLKHFVVYLHDYGCPIGLRMCIKHPEKICGIIVQNGNAYLEGIGPEWDDTRDYWANPTEEKKQKVSAFLSEEGVRMQYTAGLSEELLQRVSPEAWILDWERMSRPGNLNMQFELNCSYKTNLEMYPAFQNYFREHQPPALIIWGKHDVFFNVAEATCYQKDLPGAEVHILDGGHMALETNFNDVLQLISEFLKKTFDR